MQMRWFHNDDSRLIEATCISLGLHLGILGLQAGEWGWATGSAPLSHILADPNPPAPLNVQLASYPFSPAQQYPSTPAEKSLSLAAQKSLSPKISNQDNGSGGLGLPQQLEKVGVQINSGPGLPLHEYHDSHELTFHPQAVEEITFDIPEVETISGSGKIILTLFVNDKGGVDRAVVESQEVDKSLSHALTHRFANSKFQPARIGDSPVNSKVTIEILVRPLMRPQ
jgi:hypothetical protein